MIVGLLIVLTHSSFHLLYWDFLVLLGGFDSGVLFGLILLSPVLPMQHEHAEHSTAVNQLMVAIDSAYSPLVQRQPWPSLLIK